MNVVEYMNNVFYIEIKDKYKNNICPVCERTTLSTRKNHVIPKGFYKRNLNSLLISTAPTYIERINKLIPSDRLKNGISVKGLWCDDCENLSAKYDDKFITFLDSNTITVNELIGFIRYTCLRFYLMVLKPYDNFKTQEFAEILSILKVPSNRFLMAFLEMENPLTFSDKFIPEIYICKFELININLSYPKLHSLIQNDDERISFIIGGLFVNIFIGNSHLDILSESRALNRFRKLLNDKGLTLESLLHLNRNAGQDITQADIPIINEEILFYLLLGE